VSEYLLDTNICIAFLNHKDARLRKRLERESPDNLKLSAVVKAELWYGARDAARVAENLTKLGQFFSAFESLPFDDAAAQHYAVLRVHLKRAGMPIGGNDMLIAATALAHDVTLVTRDSDEFVRVAGLRVESW
jgi:tRNA(fMet)-specific endonuclease VapC